MRIAVLLVAVASLALAACLPDTGGAKRADMVGKQHYDRLPQETGDGASGRPR